MAAAPKKTNLIKRALIVGGALALFQVAYIFLTKQEKPLTIRQGIEKAVEKTQGVDGERKEQLRVQLAVTDFVTRNKGNPPKDLKELIPKYFDSIPIDPATKKAFEYRVEGKKFFIGSGGSALAAAKPSGEEGEAGEGTITEEESKALIASLDATQSKPRVAYDPGGKKDPFRPFDFSPDLDIPSDKGPLERYDLGQLRMTAVMDFAGEPSAIVEDPAGRGQTVKKGTKIGLHGGEVVDIQAERIVVVESETDFAGETHQKTVEIPMSGPVRPD